VQEYSFVNRYACNAEHFESTFKDRTVTNVTGEHKSGRNNDNVKMIFMEHQNCHYIPRKLSEFFKNLEVIYIKHSNVQHLLSGDLDGLDHLHTLDLSNNPIDHISDNFFKNHESLREISFENCHVKKVDEGALDMLTNLHSANFRHNECIDINGGHYDTPVAKVRQQIYNKCHGRGNPIRAIESEECAMKGGMSYVNFFLLPLALLSLGLTLTLSTVLLRIKQKMTTSNWSEAVNEFVQKESGEN
jgi:hypothetical protein